MKSGYSKLLLLTAICLGLALPASASAQVTGTTLDISQEIYANGGNPALVANSKPVGGKPIDWQRCHPDASTCVSLPSTFAYVSLGETLPGTVFKASISGAVDPEVLTSSTWLGTVSALTPPTITGSPTVGGIVKGIAGTWSGGWGRDRDSITVLACKKPTSATCDVVTGAWQTGDRYVDRPIAPAYLGWTLFAVNERLSGDELFPMMLLGKRRSNPLLQPAATGSVSAGYGPVRQSSAYSVVIFKRGVFRRTAVVVARTRCAADCDFRATVRIRFRNRATRTLTKRLANNDMLKLPRSTLRGSRSVLVAITDRGVRVARRSVSLKRHSGLSTFVP